MRFETIRPQTVLAISLIILGVLGMGFTMGGGFPSNPFFPTGAVLDFGAGNMTLTHATGTLTLAGGKFLFPGSNTPGVVAVGSSGDATTGVRFNVGGSQVVIDAAGAAIATFTGGTLYLTGTVLSFDGSANTRLTNESSGVLKQGADAAVPVAQTIKGADGSGTNIAGGNYTFGGGAGTGNAVGGAPQFATSFTGASGTTVRTLSVVARFGPGIGHLEFTNTAPTVGGSCGTSPTIAGTDQAGRVTAGTGSPTSCTVTFAKTWATAPSCYANNESTGNLLRVTSPGTTSIVLTGTLSASDVLGYGCLGYY